MLSDNSASKPPPHALFAPWTVGLASLAGTAFAGGIVLAINYRRLGKSDEAWQALAISLGVSMLLMAYMLSPDTPKFKDAEPFGLLQCLGGVLIAHKLQGESYKQHLLEGGRSGSLFQVFGITVLSIVLILIIAILCLGIHCAIFGVCPTFTK